MVRKMAQFRAISHSQGTGSQVRSLLLTGSLALFLRARRVRYPRYILCNFG